MVGDTVITTISKLRVGQFFRFIPDDWFGVARLTEKRRQEDHVEHSYYGFREVSRHPVFDIWFDADVVNPPGIIYGINGNTKVRVVSPVKIGRTAREAAGPGFIFK